MIRVLRCCLLLFFLAAWGDVHSQSETEAAPNTLQSLLGVFTDEEDAITARLTNGVVVLEGQWADEATPQALVDALQAQPGIIAVRDVTSVATLPSGFEPTVGRFEKWVDTGFAYLPLIVAALVILIAFWMVAKAVNLLEPALAKIISNPWIRSLLLQLLRLVVLIVGVVLALETLNATALVGSILGAAGIVGIAVGFAFRDLIENYISSLMLGIRQPFRPGDHVDIDGNEGIVARLTTRSTIIMTFDGNRMRIPNNQVFKSTITNFSTHPKRRFSFQVGVGYDVDLVGAINLGVDVLMATDGVLDEPAPVGRVSELGDSTVTVAFYVWVDQDAASFGRVRSESLIRVKKAFEDEQLDMPEPTYNLRITSGRAAAKTQDEVMKKATQATTATLREEETSETEFARSQAAIEADEGSDNLITADATQSELDG